MFVMTMAGLSSPTMAGLSSSPVEALPSGQQGTVALVYHGDYTRGTSDDHDVTCQGPCTPDAEKQPKCTDFFLAAYNQYVNLVVPLQQMGLQLDTFFHTYSWSYCPARDAALVDFLQPVAYRFDEQGKYPRIVDTYIAAIDIMLESGGVYDYVLLLRFEALCAPPPLAHQHTPHVPTSPAHSIPTHTSAAPLLGQRSHVEWVRGCRAASHHPLRRRPRHRRARRLVGQDQRRFQGAVRAAHQHGQSPAHGGARRRPKSPQFHRDAVWPYHAGTTSRA